MIFSSRLTKQLRYVKIKEKREKKAGLQMLKINKMSSYSAVDYAAEEHQIS